MALINCPECGKEISNTSEQCIHCGFRLQKEILVPVEEKKTSNKKIVNPVVVVVSVVVMFFLITKLAIPSVKYNSAEKLLQNDDFDEAAAKFEELGSFKDSAERVSECWQKKRKNFNEKSVWKVYFFRYFAFTRWIKHNS